MLIEYDQYLNSWIVWEKTGSAEIYRFEAKTKEECENYIKKLKKKRGKKSGSKH